MASKVMERCSACGSPMLELVNTDLAGCPHCDAICYRRACQFCVTMRRHEGVGPGPKFPRR